MSIIGVQISESIWPGPLGTVYFKKYRCPTCKRWWQHNEASFNVSCCVQHSPGDCCHYMQTEVHKKGWRKKVRA